MSAAQTGAPPSRLAVVRTLAALLERLDNSPVAVGADQYRSVVSRLSDELARATPGAALTALLETHPASAQVYENLHYQHAGLCRSSLEHSLDAERRAKEIIQRVKRAKHSPL